MEHYFTIDRVEIRDGLRVLDYDCDTGTVDFTETIGLELDRDGQWQERDSFEGWFMVRKDIGGMRQFNGERLRTTDPETGRIIA